MKKFLDAIETANVSEFASKLPLGLASPAGENGGSLSGGQRQRVSIARALIKNAPIVCLDEPTAALDAKSENYIRDSLMQMIQGKTVLMVTHRKSLLALMDVVYVLDDGKLTEVGQLGGLDRYLAELEGIEQDKLNQEFIQTEKTDVQNSEELYAQYQQFVDSQGPSEEESAYERVMQQGQQPTQQQDINSQIDNEMPSNPRRDATPWQPDQPTNPTINPQNTPPEEKNDDDVSIDLH